MNARTVFLLLAVLMAAASAQTREPRFIDLYTTEGDPVAIAVGTDGQYVALATSQGVVFLDKAMKPVWQKRALSLLDVAVTGPDVDRGPWVLATTSNQIQVWDGRGDIVWTSGSTRPIRGIEVTPDGSRIVLAQERYVETRDKEGSQVASLDLGQAETIAAPREDGWMVVAASETATLRNAGGAVDKIIPFTTYVGMGIRRPVSASISGDNVLIGFTDGSFFYHRPGLLNFSTQVPGVSRPVLVQMSKNLFAVAAGPTIVLYDLFANKLNLPSPGGDVVSLSLTKDGAYLAVATKDRKAWLYDLTGTIPSFLNVTSSPNGTVIVDGASRGTTPLKVEVPPGPRKVVVNNSTVGEIPVTVVVPFGGTANISLNLSRLAFPAALEVNSAPAGAEVHVDGSFLGKAPITLGLSSGNHTVRVALAGHAAYTTTVNLTRDNLTRLNVTLAPAGQTSSAEQSKQELAEGSAKQQAGAGREGEWGIKVVSPAPQASPTPTPEPPGFEAALAIAALALAGLAAARRRKN